MTMILALMEAARGKILTRSSYTMHASMYCIDEHLTRDIDVEYEESNKPLPFTDEGSL